MSDIKFFDLNINRKGNLSDNNIVFFKRSKELMPSVIEISNSGMCNRKCIFCPRSAPDYKEVNEFISEKLFDNIVLELKENSYSGTIIFSGFVEPLLDKRIYDQIKKLRLNLPTSNLEIITNGDPLNEKRILKLYESGLSVLLLSIYDTEEDAKKFELIFKKNNISSDRYVIRRRFLSKEENFGITISNRGGMMQNTPHKILPLKEPLKKPCNYPAYNFFIDYNGDVLICSHDWGKKNIAGNLNIDSIEKVWLSTIFENTRKNLIKGSRNFAPCNICDVEGSLIGKNHAELWKKKY